MAYILLIVIACIIISRWHAATTEDPFHPKHMSRHADQEDQYAPVKEYRYTYKHGRHQYTNINTVMLKKYTSVMTTDEYKRYEDLIFGLCGIGYTDGEIQDMEKRLREKSEKKLIARQLMMFNLRESA